MKIFLALVLVVGGAIAAGCAKAQAKRHSEPPALEVPMPPPRNVEATEQPEPPPPVVPPEEPAAPAAPPRPRPAPANARSGPNRVLSLRAQRHRRLPEPQRPADETRCRRILCKTTPAVRQAQVEQDHPRYALTSASTNLNKVDYRALNADARTQHDQAKRFISQAQDRCGKKISYLRRISPKNANTLASQLSGR